MAPKKRVAKKKDEAEAAGEGNATALESGVVVEAPPTEHVILQLPIGGARLDELMEPSTINDVLEYKPVICDPQPYVPQDTFASFHGTLAAETDRPGAGAITGAVAGEEASAGDEAHPKAAAGAAPACFWCCHAVDHMEYGMPIRYDVFHKSFTMFGTFCSLECAAAYNYSTNMGSDRVWEIHSWIQMLAHRYGYEGHVRPAPSRYLLKMFNGPMDIDQFRRAHRGRSRTYVLNVPPFIHVPSQMEVINTSFLEAGGGGAGKAGEATRNRRWEVTSGSTA